MSVLILARSCKPQPLRLAQFIRQHQDNATVRGATGLERFERELHEHVMAVERDSWPMSSVVMMSRQTRSRSKGLVPSQPGVHTDIRQCGGSITVPRHLYRPAGRSTKSICPLELRAGIVEGLWTPRAARQGAFVMAHLTPVKALCCLRNSADAALVSTLDGYQDLSARFEAKREVWEATLRACETVPEEARSWPSPSMVS